MICSAWNPSQFLLVNHLDEIHAHQGWYQHRRILLLIDHHNQQTADHFAAGHK